MARRDSRMSPSSPTDRRPAPSGPDIPSPGAQEPAGHPDGVLATARIRAAHNGRVTTLPQLHSDGPFHLRRLRTHGNAAKVGIISAMSAPLGGDRLTLDITAEDRAEVEITTAAATLALRGPTTDAATYDVRLTIGEHARMRWLPQPLISAAGSNLHQTYTVELAATSHLVLREDSSWAGPTRNQATSSAGSWSTAPGSRYSTSTRPTGPPNQAGDGPAVLNGHRAVGQLLSCTRASTSDETPSCSAKRSRRGAPSSHRWQAARHCSPPPSHPPPRHCGNCSTRHTHTRSPVNGCHGPRMRRPKEAQVAGIEQDISDAGIHKWPRSLLTLGARPTAAAVDWRGLGHSCVGPPAVPGPCSSL